MLKVINESDIKLELTVYDKHTWTQDVMKIVWPVAIPFILILVFIITIYSKKEMDDSTLLPILFWLSVPLLFFIGLINIIDSYNTWVRTVGETTTLRVDSKFIRVFYDKFEISFVKKIILRLSTAEEEWQFSNNNYIEIQTIDNRYELGLIIKSRDEITKVERLISYLRDKKIEVILENRL